ncbi:MAG: BrnA antitoxin family protein [Rhodobacteraceae bacterium]|nr:BrnA antitoxin family protein [Paracoccaceae bacterium]
MPRPTVTDQDNPEWTEDDFARARPARELPAHVRAAFPRTRGPQKAATKVHVSIRLSPEVIEHFKAGGPGWQSRIDDALRKAAGV